MIFTKMFYAVLNLFFLIALASASFYKNSPVLELNSQNFKSRVLDTQHLTIVEFYAPWCGHCQNLKPEYIKAAKSLKGLANLAAIDCDDSNNKQLCSQYGVRGFPTIKIFGPSYISTSDKKKVLSRKSKFLDDYNGARTAKAIIDVVNYRLPSHAKVVNSVKKFNEKFVKHPRVLLIAGSSSTGNNVPPAFKSLSIDYFRNSTDPSLNPVFGFIPFRNQADAFKTLNYNKEPNRKLSLLAIYEAGDSENPIFYEGAMKKELISKFISKYLSPTDLLTGRVSAKNNNFQHKRHDKDNVKRSTVMKNQKQLQKSSASKSSSVSSRSKKEKENKTERKPPISVAPSTGAIEKTEEKPEVVSTPSLFQDESTSIIAPGITGVSTAGPRIGKSTKLYANRIYTTDDLRSYCFQPDSKPCLLAVLSVNGQISGMRTFNQVEKHLPTSFRGGHDSINWIHMIDISEDDTSGDDEVAYMARIFGLKPYYPSPWKVQDNKSKYENLNKLGLGEMKPSDNWDHPPAVVYINGRENYIINFPANTEVDSETVTKFLIACSNGTNRQNRKKMPNGFFVAKRHDEL